MKRCHSENPVRKENFNAAFAVCDNGDFIRCFVGLVDYAENAPTVKTHCALFAKPDNANARWIVLSRVGAA